MEIKDSIINTSFYFHRGDIQITTNVSNNLSNPQPIAIDKSFYVNSI